MEDINTAKNQKKVEVTVMGEGRGTLRLRGGGRRGECLVLSPS